MKIKIDMHPKVKLVVDVNKTMKADFLECREMAKQLGDCKDCDKCSWNELCIESTGICEMIGPEDLEEMK